ncbi:MAG TPA: PIN domain-containing protein [Candidatus Woesebacteria bacterium]|nr:PIN domain-containing protein [Candidatus Woesebacteria bacterium]
MIDTNVVLRLFVDTDSKLHQRAERILFPVFYGQQQAVISILAISEIIWILDSYYQIKKKEYVPMVIGLLSCKNIRVYELDRSEAVSLLQAHKITALSWVDLYLYLLSRKNGFELASFDKKLVRRMAQPNDII